MTDFNRTPTLETVCILILIGAKSQYSLDASLQKQECPFNVILYVHKVDKTIEIS